MGRGRPAWQRAAARKRPANAAPARLLPPPSCPLSNPPLAVCVLPPLPRPLQPLLDAVVDYLPAPTDLPDVKGTAVDDPEKARAAVVASCGC